MTGIKPEAPQYGKLIRAIALGAVTMYCLVVAVRVIRATPPRSAGRSADRRIVLEGHAGVAE